MKFFTFNENQKQPLARQSVFAGVLYLMLAGLLASLSSCTEEKPKELPPLSQEALIKRGEYLVTISGCHDCHSPKVMTPHGPEPDPARLLSGHPAAEPISAPIQTTEWILFNNGLTAFVGPWGVSYAANLTPDDTGTGRWTYEQFQTAIRKGKFKGLERGRSLLPPMPWQMYKNMTDEDLQSIFAYLQSVKPVTNLVPSPVPPTEVQWASNSN